MARMAAARRCRADLEVSTHTPASRPVSERGADLKVGATFRPAKRARRYVPPLVVPPTLPPIVIGGWGRDHDRICRAERRSARVERCSALHQRAIAVPAMPGQGRDARGTSVVRPT